MLFAVPWTFAPENRDAANERFLASGGPPPEGVTMLGRWHTLGEGEGFCICETSNPVALGKWMMQWSDLLEFRISPVVDDQGALQMLSS
jgi:hypothetical protein